MSIGGVDVAHRIPNACAYERHGTTGRVRTVAVCGTTGSVRTVARRPVRSGIEVIMSVVVIVPVHPAVLRRSRQVYIVKPLLLHLVLPPLFFLL